MAKAKKAAKAAKVEQPLSGKKLGAFLNMETRPHFAIGERLATVKAVFDAQGRKAAEELAKKLVVSKPRRERWFKEWARK